MSKIPTIDELMAQQSSERQSDDGYRHRDRIFMFILNGMIARKYDVGCIDSLGRPIFTEDDCRVYHGAAVLFGGMGPVMVPTPETKADYADSGSMTPEVKRMVDDMQAAVYGDQAIKPRRVPTSPGDQPENSSQTTDLEVAF